jgi:PTH1 family peptidyl-tRNA hydrolase
LKKEKQFSALVGSGGVSIRYQKKIKTTIPLSVEDGSEPIQNINKIIYQKKIITEEYRKEIEILVCKPLTFMNQSGTAVQALMNYYKIPKENLLVIHDDVSLDTGKIRMAFNRGAGGQHGVEDIINKLGGDKGFHRLKFGVGPDPGGDLRGDYVLKKFPKEEAPELKTKISEALNLLKTWLVEEDAQQVTFH